MMAMASRTLKGKNIDKTNILNQIQKDFARTMNQIIMDKFMALPAQAKADTIPDALTMPPK